MVGDGGLHRRKGHLINLGQRSRVVLSEKRSGANMLRAGNRSDRRPVRMQGMDEELVVLCAEDGSAAGAVSKTTVHGPDTPLHLAFSCYLFDAHGRVLVTRRAGTKRTFAGVRTNSCCGHPAPGETMTGAVIRRVRYELGVTPTEVSLILPAFRYRAAAADGTVENELCPVYRAVLADPTVRPNPVEVSAAWWVDWAEFVAEPSGTDPLSAWACAQARDLAAVGPDPYAWPVADPALLPAAVVREPGSS